MRLRARRARLSTHHTRFWCGLWSLLLPAAGCATGLATAMYVIRGNATPPEYAGLKEQRVVVVCRAPSDLPFQLATVPKDLARQIGNRLAANVPKITRCVTLTRHRRRTVLTT